MAEVSHRERSEARDAGEPVISCNCCRIRKLRCSRELPTCQQCRKTGNQCEYKREKTKPGMKPGAIDSLHRRLDQMEESLEQLRSATATAAANAAATSGRTSADNGDDDDESTVQRVMAVLAREIHRLGSSSQLARPSPGLGGGHNQQQNDQHQQRRRPRLGTPDESNHHQQHQQQQQQQTALGSMPPLPPALAINQVIEIYFSRMHPWIPMVQENRFKQRLDDPSEQPQLLVVLHAMVVAAARYVCSGTAPAGGSGSGSGQLLCGITAQELEAYRGWVVARAMSSLAIENLQALIIIAFNDIGNARAMRAWPIIGSLTRTVEYLQLTVEQDDLSRPPPLSRPYVTSALREECTSWIEQEERRRVFWSIFNLDRFCSITMGWNTSLTSDDVHRRLPCDISLWWQDEPVLTPYFNIWDKSAGRIGNPIAFLPSHYKSSEASAAAAGDSGAGAGADAGGPAVGVVPGFDERKADRHRASATPGVGGRGGPGTPANSWRRDFPFGGGGSEKMTVGAFAYSVEATESLSQVTTYFLQQRVNMRDGDDIESWLTRFKELDLRLIHWKMLLPQKWKPDMGQRHRAIRMDPNLTLAHITHNTSIVLLHQAIAFPRLDWAFKNRLPSLSSAETCRAAAVMVAAIASNYLDMLPAIPVAHLFAFCIFVCARALIVHWRYYGTPKLSPEFDSLVGSLDFVSAQWRGVLARDADATSAPQASASFPSTSCDTLAGMYAARLRRLRQRCLDDESFRIDPSSYTMDGGDSSETWSTTPGGHVPQTPHEDAEAAADLRRLQQQRYHHSNQHPESSDFLPARDSQSQQVSPVSTTSMLQSSSLAYHRDQQPRLDLEREWEAQGGQVECQMDGQHQPMGQAPTYMPLVGAGANVGGPPGAAMDGISQLFLDPQFFNVDRIISVENDMFDIGYGDMAWS